jgi:hypothetical protein
MGLLDDAIKEHLELKRRHGADPGEIARLEHEALGPARREPAATTVADEPMLDEPDEPGLDEADDDYEDEVPADERLEAPVHYAEPEPEPEPEPPAADEPADTELRVPEFDPEPRHEPEPEAAAPPPEPEAIDQPTRQFSIEELEDASAPPARPAEPAAAPPADDDDEPAPHADVVPADEEPDGDDVLEETPEFLQETPEHDRLWFEQKPPKDFDF